MTVTDYAEGIRAERARKASVVTEFAKAIDGDVRSNDYDGPCEVSKDIDGAPIEFRPDWHKRRWCVSVNPPTMPGGNCCVTIRNDPRPEATVAMDRSPDAIIADVRRRLVPDAIAWLEKARAVVDSANRHESAIAASIESLRTSAKAAGVKVQDGGQRRTPGNEGVLWVDGEMVRVSANWFGIERPNWDKAENVVAAIRTMRKS